MKRTWSILFLMMALSACEPPPSCTDGVQNQSETDVDCGGGLCAACATGQVCVAAGDCQGGACTRGVCGGAVTSDPCKNGVKDGNETDVDCGGGTCPACADKKACTNNSDCASQMCTARVCSALTVQDAQGLALDASGNSYVVDARYNVIVKIAPSGAASILAGSPGPGGSSDGMGSAARFNNPNGVLLDSAGNLIIADNGNGTIRKITPAGVVTTIAGTAQMMGAQDGNGVAAQFRQPSQLAIDGAGTLFVTDSGNHLIRMIALTGDVSTVAGKVGDFGCTDAVGTAASFNSPRGIAVDGSGNLYVADAANSLIRKIVLSTKTVSTVAGTCFKPGFNDGTGAAALLASAAGVVLDGGGNLYVADTGNRRIRKIVLATAAVSTIAGSSGAISIMDGTGAGASFIHPFSITKDGAGDLYVTDMDDLNMISVIRKVTPAGVVTTIFK